MEFISSIVLLSIVGTLLLKEVTNQPVKLDGAIRESERTLQADVGSAGDDEVSEGVKLLGGYFVGIYLRNLLQSLVLLEILDRVPEKQIHQTKESTDGNTTVSQTLQLVDDRPEVVKVPQESALICPFNQVYDECHSKCPVTCENHHKVIVCEKSCRKGCGCPPDKVLKSNGQCLHPSECQFLGN